MELPFRRLRPDAELPEAAHAGDAGLDLRAMEPSEVAPGERAMVPTGLAVAIPGRARRPGAAPLGTGVEAGPDAGERAGPDRRRLPRRGDRARW